MNVRLRIGEENNRSWGQNCGKGLLARRARWDNMSKRGLGNMSKKELKQSIKEGVPFEYRREVWIRFLGVDVEMKENRGYYSMILDKQYDQLTPEMEQIEMDVRRTFPGHPIFDSEEGITKLRHVLNAYSLHNPSIGYCQSMNFVVAMLLVVLTEEEAFWAFVRITETVLPHDYYSEYMQAIVVDQQVFQHLIEKRLPRIAKKFGEFTLPVSSLLSQWFLCLFVNSLPAEISLRIWDCLFVDGFSVLMSVALAVLKINTNVILSCNEESEAYSKIRSLGHQIVSGDQLVDMCYNDRMCFVTMAKITSLRKKLEPMALGDVGQPARIHERIPRDRELNRTRPFEEMVQRRQQERTDKIQKAVQDALQYSVPGKERDYAVVQKNANLDAWLAQEDTEVSNFLKQLSFLDNQLDQIGRELGSSASARHAHLHDQLGHLLSQLETDRDKRERKALPADPLDIMATPGPNRKGVQQVQRTSDGDRHTRQSGGRDAGQPARGRGRDSGEVSERPFRLPERSRPHNIVQQTKALPASPLSIPSTPMVHQHAVSRTTPTS
mmetsp:Transcript_33599/g.94524  ORF Transcript_33599/g.94524 Transcript_33599/m.94524 type:complete len:552 (-) Transcript_33599:227-1882(-)